jgi:uncharacterized SAM-binding protein YcdF (DUF218 family)
VGHSRSAARRLALAFILFVAAALLTSPIWLPAVGTLLVENDSPAKADIGVVLGGDYRGTRISKAAELVQAGYIPQVLVSGPSGFFGMHESDLAISYMVRRGYPAGQFISLPNDTRSTEEEAAVVLAELQRRGIHSFILITSDYHTRRAARTYRYVGRSMGYLPAMRAVVAWSPLFQINRWWKTREGQKAIFFEWSKTVAFAVGL